MDCSLLLPHSSILVIGRRRPSTTTLVQEIVHHIKTRPGIPGNTMRALEMVEWDDESVATLAASEEGREALIVCDGGVRLASATTWRTSPGLREVIFNGRHRRIDFVCTMPSSFPLPPDVCANIDYVFLTEAFTDAERGRLYRKFASGAFPTREAFDAALLHQQPGYLAIPCCAKKGEQTAEQTAAAQQEQTGGLLWDWVARFWGGAEQ